MEAKGQLTQENGPANTILSDGRVEQVGLDENHCTASIDDKGENDPGEVPKGKSTTIETPDRVSILPTGPSQVQELRIYNVDTKNFSRSCDALDLQPREATEKPNTWLLYLDLPPPSKRKSPQK